MMTTNPLTPQPPRRAPGPGRARSRLHMRGGTLLGLIIGMIIGMALSLIVAVYIGKVPIPIVNNAPVSNAEQNAAQDKKNQNWNPNQVLQSHGPVVANGASGEAGAEPARAPKPGIVTRGVAPPPVEVDTSPSAVIPSPDIAPTDPSAAPPGPPPPAPRPVAKTPQAPSNNVTSADILGEFAAEHTQRAVPQGDTPGDETHIYWLQTGAYHDSTDADSERARLSLMGIQSQISVTSQAGQVVYRVRVGPFQNKSAADQIQTRLTDEGFHAALLRMQH